MKLREASGNGDMISRLEAAETKLQELKSNMGDLGKEAVAAMTAVEAQQQRLTLQRLIALVHSLYCFVFGNVCYANHLRMQTIETLIWTIRSTSKGHGGWDNFTIWTRP